VHARSWSQTEMAGAERCLGPVVNVAAPTGCLPSGGLSRRSSFDLGRAGYQTVRARCVKYETGSAQPKLRRANSTPRPLTTSPKVT
jgi:hypothetical protein